MRAIKSKIAILFLIIISISCNRSSPGEQSGEKPEQTRGLKIETPQQSNKRKHIPKDVSDFMINTSIEKMYSIELHKLALARLQEINLKSTAKRNAEADVQLQKELTQLAEQENITLPIVIDKVHQRAYEKLNTMKDPEEFKKEYISLFNESIENTNKLFEKGARKISNIPVKIFIGKKLPVIKARNKHPVSKLRAAD